MILNEDRLCTSYFPAMGMSSTWGLKSSVEVACQYKMMSRYRVFNQQVLVRPAPNDYFATLKTFLWGNKEGLIPLIDNAYNPHAKDYLIYSTLDDTTVANVKYDTESKQWRIKGEYIPRGDKFKHARPYLASKDLTKLLWKAKPYLHSKTDMERANIKTFHATHALRQKMGETPVPSELGALVCAMVDKDVADIEAFEKTVTATYNAIKTKAMMAAAVSAMTEMWKDHDRRVYATPS